MEALSGEHPTPQLSSDEVAVTNGDLCTVLTNKVAGAMVAMMEGMKVCVITPILAKIPFETRTLVTEVTLDMSESMNAIVKQALPNGTLVLDRFHVQHLVSDVGQDIRIGVRRDSHQRREPPDQTSPTGGRPRGQLVVEVNAAFPHAQ